MAIQRWFLVAAVLTLFGVGAALPTSAAPLQVTAGDLRASLDSLLTEHEFLASAATNAALGGRDDEFQAAAAALDANSVDLSKAIGSVYGADAENAFLPLWRSHIGFFVDYTTGKAKQDQAMQDKAVSDLLGYSEDFAAFISGANPNLPKQAVVDLLNAHVTGLKDVVDQQAAGDQAAAYMTSRVAFAHMTMIANPLTDAIVQQFPEKFGTAAGGTAAGTGGEHHGMPAQMPNTGIADTSTWILLPLVALMLAAGLILVRRGRRSA